MNRPEAEVMPEHDGFDEDGPYTEADPSEYGIGPDVAEHLWSHPKHQGTDWGAWAEADELERMGDDELHDLWHGAVAFAGHRSDELTT